MTFSEKKNSTWKKSETVLFTCSLSCNRSLARLYGEEWPDNIYKESLCRRETGVTKDGCVVDYMTTLSIKESPSLVLYGQIIISQNKLNCSEA